MVEDGCQQVIEFFLVGFFSCVEIVFGIGHDIETSPFILVVCDIFDDYVIKFFYIDFEAIEACVVSLDDDIDNVWCETDQKFRPFFVE